MGINSPLPVRLEEECRKAAKIVRSFVDSGNNGLDKVVPRNILERAHGFAIFTVFKAGFVVSARAGSGVVIARTQDGSWSPPSAIGLGGFGFGGQMGAEVTDFLIVLNNRAAVASFMSAGSLTLGGNMSVAVGPLGRNAEGAGAVNTKGKVAAMYSYSKTKGLFGGVSVEGSILVERQDANRLAYGGSPTAKQILSGTFDPPEWAYDLISELDRCTGMPGGQRWRSRDEDGEGGGMGWNSPREERSGYLFGEGAHAGGSTPPKRSRAGTVSSMFSNDGGRARSGSLGEDNKPSPTAAGGRGTPTRPNMAYKRSTSFNPFSSGTKSPARAGPVSSSESYNAGLTWDSSGPANRSRAGSGATRPYNFDPEDLLGKEDIWNNGLGSRSKTGTPRDSPRGTMDDYVGDFGERPSRNDLIGEWESNGHGLAASFAKMKVADGGNRSRSNSKPKPPANLFDEREDEYTPYETTSSFGRNGVPGKLTKPAGAGRYSAMDDSSPFGEGTIGQGRAFEQYQTPSSPSRAYSESPRPYLAIKKGLEKTDDGYARAIGLFPFNATDSGDLGLKKGTVVIVLDSVGNGDWWSGRDPSTGKEGIFPCNYVEVLDVPKNLRGGVSKGQLKKRVIRDDFD